MFIFVWILALVLGEDRFVRLLIDTELPDLAVRGHRDPRVDHLRLEL